MGPARLLSWFSRPVTIAAVICGIALGPFAVSFATAQDDGDVADLRQQREDTRREAADVASELDALSAEDEELVAAIAALDAHIALQEERIVAAEASIAAAEVRAVAASDEAAALGDDMDVIRDRLRQRAVDLFVSPRLDTLEQLNNEDLLEGELKKTYIDEWVGDETDLIAALRTAQAARDEAERVAIEAAAEAEAERGALDERLTALDTSRREAEELRAAVSDRVEEWEAVSRELDAADAAIGQEIRDLEVELARQAAAAEAARIAAEEAAAAAAGGDVESDSDEAEIAEPVNLGPFVVTHRPVPGNISSSFGPRVHPIFGSVRNHYGLDFYGPTGQAISAAADGVVLSAEWSASYGWLVVLSHGDGFTTLYAHQSELNVAAGDVVAGGDVVGFVGSTGNSTGPHLHWEIRVDGVAVNPAEYL